jgi:hypothetical protein
MASPEPQDQLRTTTPGVINGCVTQLTAATMKATMPSGSVYTFTTPYSFHFEKKLVQFHQGQPVHLDAKLKAALLAAGAPMTAA